MSTILIIILLILIFGGAVATMPAVAMGMPDWAACLGSFWSSL
jgi:hypothetical protein